jgi:hypothetical protein
MASLESAKPPDILPAVFPKSTPVSTTDLDTVKEAGGNHEAAMDFVFGSVAGIVGKTIEFVGIWRRQEETERRLTLSFDLDRALYYILLLWTPDSIKSCYFFISLARSVAFNS